MASSRSRRSTPSTRRRVALALEEGRELVPGAPVVADERPDGRGARRARRAALAGEVAATVERAAARGRRACSSTASFSLRGIGTVVTGTLWSGSIGEGDELRVAARRVARPRPQRPGARPAGRARRGRPARRRRSARHRAGGARGAATRWSSRTPTRSATGSTSLLEELGVESRTDARCTSTTAPPSTTPGSSGSASATRSSGSRAGRRRTRRPRRAARPDDDRRRRRARPGPAAPRRRRTASRCSSAATRRRSCSARSTAAPEPLTRAELARRALLDAGAARARARRGRPGRRLVPDARTRLDELAATSRLPSPSGLPARRSTRASRSPSCCPGARGLRRSLPLLPLERRGAKAYAPGASAQLGDRAEAAAAARGRARRQRVRRRSSADDRELARLPRGRRADSSASATGSCSAAAAYDEARRLARRGVRARGPDHARALPRPRRRRTPRGSAPARALRRRRADAAGGRGARAAQARPRRGAVGRALERGIFVPRGVNDSRRRGADPSPDHRMRCMPLRAILVVLAVSRACRGAEGGTEPTAAEQPEAERALDRGALTVRATRGGGRWSALASAAADRRARRDARPPRPGVRLADLRTATRLMPERCSPVPTTGLGAAFGPRISASRDASECTVHVCFHWVDPTRDAPPRADGDGDSCPITSRPQRPCSRRSGRKSRPLGYRPPKTGRRVEEPRAGRTARRLPRRRRRRQHLRLLHDRRPEHRRRRMRYGDLSAYCVLDNDFAPAQFPGSTTPDEALRVTAAHEFFHAVQFGYDAYEDGWFMEGTAVWMEDEVYDGIDDNHQYLQASALARPECRSTSPSATSRIRSPASSTARSCSGATSRSASDGTSCAGCGSWPTTRPAEPTAIRSPPSKRCCSTKRGPPDDVRAFGTANVFPESFYEEGAGYPSPVLHRHSTLSRPRRPRPAPRLTLDHLTTWYASYHPGPRTPRGARLRVTLDLPTRARGADAAIVLLSRSGPCA